MNNKDLTNAISQVMGIPCKILPPDGTRPIWVELSACTITTTEIEKIKDATKHRFFGLYAAPNGRINLCIAPTDIDENTAPI